VKTDLALFTRSATVPKLKYKIARQTPFIQLSRLCWQEDSYLIESSGLVDIIDLEEKKK
jgi:hypothetical protein